MKKLILIFVLILSTVLIADAQRYRPACRQTRVYCPNRFYMKPPYYYPACNYHLAYAPTTYWVEGYWVYNYGYRVRWVEGYWRIR